MAGQRSNLLFGKLKPQTPVDFSQRHGGIDRVMAGCQLLKFSFSNIIFIIDIADDLLNDIFKGDDPSMPPYSSTTIARCSRIFQETLQKHTDPFLTRHVVGLAASILEGKISRALDICQNIFECNTPTMLSRFS